jgi:hypothetical protein
MRHRLSGSAEIATVGDVPQQAYPNASHQVGDAHLTVHPVRLLRLRGSSLMISDWCVASGRICLRIGTPIKRPQNICALWLIHRGLRCH